jgi:hypothetical protein
LPLKFGQGGKEFLVLALDFLEGILGWLLRQLVHQLPQIFLVQGGSALRQNLS